MSGLLTLHSDRGRTGSFGATGGTATAAWASTGSTREAGLLLAACMRHCWIGFDKHHPGHFVNVSMRHYCLKRNQSFCPTVSLDELWTLVSEQTGVSAAKNKTRAPPNIDVARSSYYEVLGKEKLPKQPVLVKSKLFSRRAEKIKSVCWGRGGCVLVA